MSASFAYQDAVRDCVARGLWPRCKVAHCRNEAALGGACAELHGGAVPSPSGWVLMIAPPPGDGDDGDDWPDLESCAPQLGPWQAWVISEGHWRTQRRRSRSFPLRARAVRALLRAERISRIFLLNQFQAQNAFFPGLELDAELRAAALALIEYELPLDPEHVELLRRHVEAVCASHEALRRLRGLPVFERRPLEPGAGSSSRRTPDVPPGTG
jgi:hypothetical protein